MRQRSVRGVAACVAVAGACVLIASPAAAQGAIDRAREAFSRGLAAEEAGRPAEACAAYRESLALVRELGPLRKSAACDEREGRLGDAAEALEEVLRGLPADDAERAAIEASLQAVRARMARVVLVRRPGSGATARIDGRALDDRAGDVLLDPGTHDVVVDVPGEPGRVVRLVVHEGETVHLEIPPARGDRRIVAPLAPAARPARQPPRSDTLRTAGWVIGGVGLAGMLGAGVTGVALLDDQAELEACEASPGCDASILAERASSLVVVNAVAWGVGVLGLGVGTTLVVLDATSDDEPAATWKAEVGLGGASVRGRF